MTCKKRILGILAAVTICLVAAVPVLAGETRPLKLLFATDLHFISPALTDNGEYFTRLVTGSDGKLMLKSSELLDCFLDAVLEEAPDALVLGGDLTFNGARRSHEDLAAKLETLTDAGIPVLALSGNHDINTPNAASFSRDSFTRVSSVDADAFFAIYHGLGYDDALSTDSASGSYIYAPGGGLRILMLDVNSRSVNQVPGASFAWIGEQLEEAEEAGDRVLAVSHQNLFVHNLLFSDGYQIRNASALEIFYRQHGVICNLSGHMHLQHSILEDVPVPEIVTSALSVWPCHYAVLTWDGESLSYETKKLDVSGWAGAQGLTDPELLDFPAYAADFFHHSTITSLTGQLAQADLDEGQKSEMIRTACAVNDAVFSGEVFDPEEYAEGFSLLERQTDTLYPLYLYSVKEDLPKDFNRAVF